MMFSVRKNISFLLVGFRRTRELNVVIYADVAQLLLNVANRPLLRESQEVPAFSDVRHRVLCKITGKQKKGWRVAEHKPRGWLLCATHRHKNSSRCSRAPRSVRRQASLVTRQITLPTEKTAIHHHQSTKKERTICQSQKNHFTKKKRPCNTTLKTKKELSIRQILAMSGPVSFPVCGSVGQQMEHQTLRCQRRPFNPWVPCHTRCARPRTYPLCHCA